MPEQDDRSGPTLQLDEAGENDFRAFSVIENTLIGILVFVASYLRTCWILLRHPASVGDLLASDKQGRAIAKPFTYLGISSFLSSLVFLNLSPLIGGNPSNIKAEIQGISIAGMLKTVLPVVFVVVGLALLLARAIGRHNRLRRLQIVRAVCYAAGYQFLLFFLIFLGFFMYEKSSRWNEQFEFIAGMLAWAFMAYTVFIPGIILWKVSIGRFAGVKRKISRSVLFLAFEGFGVIVFYTAVLVVTASRILDPWALIGIEDRKVDFDCLDVKANFTAPDLLQLVVLVKNKANQPLFLYRSPAYMSIDWWEEEVGGSKQTRQTGPIPMTISSWSDGDATILALEPKQTKWMQTSLHFPAYLQAVLTSPSSYPLLARYIEFETVEPSTAVCYIGKEILGSPQSN